MFVFAHAQLCAFVLKQTHARTLDDRLLLFGVHCLRMHSINYPCLGKTINLWRYDANDRRLHISRAFLFTDPQVRLCVNRVIDDLLPMISVLNNTNAQCMPETAKFKVILTTMKRYLIDVRSWLGMHCMLSSDRSFFFKFIPQLLPFTSKCWKFCRENRSFADFCANLKNAAKIITLLFDSYFFYTFYYCFPTFVWRCCRISNKDLVRDLLSTLSLMNLYISINA